jgi:hypothetical protein
MVNSRQFSALISTIAILTQGCSGVAGPGLIAGAPPIFSVSFPADVHLSAHVDPLDAPPTSWQPAVRFTNIGKDVATVEHGACSVAVWIYPATAQSAAPVWDNRLPPNSACIAIGYMRRVAPGESYDLIAGVLDRSLLGGLPAGDYKVVLAVRPSVRQDAQLTVLPAGQITLGF